MLDKNILAICIGATLILAMFTYINVYFVLFFRKKQYQYYMEKQRWLGFAVEERDRLMEEIAKEIHDNMGQLTHMLYMTFHRMVKVTDPDERLMLQENVDQLIDQLAMHTRDISYSLNNDFIRTRGLSVVLQQDIERIRATGQINCILDLQGPTRQLDPDKELIIYRIAQEAMHNGLQHSGTDTLCFILAFNKEDFTLTISDKGIGFDSKSAGNKGGTGLINMYKRAASLNAILDIDTVPGKGTQIKLIVPYI